MKFPASEPGSLFILQTFFVDFLSFQEVRSQKRSIIF